MRCVGKDGIVRVPVTANNGHEDIVAEIIVPGENLPVPFVPGGGIDAGFRLGQREDLVKEYWERKEHFVKALEERGEVVKAVDGIICEMISETDKLLGNEMVATSKNDLAASTAISVKRVEALQLATKTLMQRQRLARELDLDIEHPQFEVVFRWFLDKSKEAMERVRVESEVSDLFFIALGELIQNWKSELKEKLVDASQGNGKG